jgi:predicted HTH transcriptional regulator
MLNLDLKESQAVEFKQIWKDEYLKTICAFANTDGGVLYLGIKYYKSKRLKNSCRNSTKQDKQ